MDPARISELLRPFLGPSPPENLSSRAQPDGSLREPSGAVEGPAVLSPTQLQLISTYIDLLLRWNARMNLTSVRDPEQIVTRHFGESLFAARHLFPRVPHPSRFSKGGDFPNDHVIDLGSGAGFPGLPIKIWAPHIRLTLVESDHKKATFLREVPRALTLTNVNVFAGRAENIVGQLQTAMTDQEAWTNERCTVTLRAVERLETILPTALNLARHGGRLALLIGQAQVGAARALAPTIDWSEAALIPLSSSRVLFVGDNER